MRALPIKPWNIITGSVVMITIVASLFSVPPARADVGVGPILPGGSDISPEGETPIEMASERVVLTVRPATVADNAVIDLNPQAYGLDASQVWYPAVAEVKANFTMRNPTDEPLGMTVWFPLASALENVSWELNPDESVPRIVGFRVTVDEKPVEVSEGELPNPKGEDKPPLPWASFPVTFQPGKKTSIHVSYTLPLHRMVKGNALALYYIFQTGAGWAGPIGQAELLVELPYPASAETLAGIPPGSFSPPYAMSNARTELPHGAVLEGTQARWIWENLEPGPKDDFAVWLMNPGEWQALETARAAVQADPQNGQDWLELANIYRSLATSGYNSPSVFSSSYREPGLEAYRKAAGLLPEHPAPHAGLALLLLSAGKEAAPDILAAVQEEIRIAQDLEARNPALAQETGPSSLLAEDALSMVLYNDATATAEAAFLATGQAAQTTAVAPAITPAPADAAAADAAATDAAAAVAQAPTTTPFPTRAGTHLPAATAVPLPGMPARSGFGLLACILLAGGLFFLAFVLYMVVRGRQVR